MARNEVKAKSVRKALKDISNNHNSKNGGRFSNKSMNLKKKIFEKEKEDCCFRAEEGEEEEGEEEGEYDSLDRLLLVQSDLSAVLRQVDELVAKAFILKASTKRGRKEIESFTHVLSEMLSSLKPWVPRFQRALSGPSMESENQLGQSLASKAVSSVNEDECNEVDSPEETKLGSLISPSPLVSWRANCTIERGRQLFLLTPLPISKALSSKHWKSSKLVFENITCNTTVGLPSFHNISEDANDLLEGVAKKPSPTKPSDSVVAETRSTLDCVSSPVFSKRGNSILVMTPCLKMSPPKSCALLDHVSESFHKSNFMVRKSTPFHAGTQNHRGSQFSESSDNEASDGLALKYPELLGIQRAYKSGIGRKELEDSPDWLFSPPKSCVLLEPPDEKSLDNIAADCHLPITSCVFNQQTDLSLSKGNDIEGGCHQTKNSCNQEPVGGSFALIESTPLWKEPESTIRTGKRPGENTLKKELWTRFEAASSYGHHYDVSAVQRTARKGFLDMLEEVSCDEESSMPHGLR